MSNRINNKALKKIRRLHEKYGTWLLAAEYLLEANNQPLDGAASVAALLNSAANGNIKSSPTLVNLLRLKRQQYRLAVSFGDDSERDAVKVWAKNQGYDSFNQWFYGEIWNR